MIVSQTLLRVALVTLFSATNIAAPSARPAGVFAPSLPALQHTVRIPVLLPSRLPSVLRAPSVSSVRVTTAVADSYSVELRYKGLEGDAGFAALFAGSRKYVGEIPGSKHVRLENGTLGQFRPVSCGGSCAPAALWWRHDGVVYLISIRLSPDTPESKQKKVLLEVANAMVRVSIPSLARTLGYSSTTRRGSVGLECSAMATRRFTRRPSPSRTAAVERCSWWRAGRATSWTRVGLGISRARVRANIEGLLGD
jgi:hypothetical protein